MKGKLVIAGLGAVAVMATGIAPATADSTTTATVSTQEGTAIANKLTTTKARWAGANSTDVVAAMPYRGTVLVLAKGGDKGAKAVQSRIPKEYAGKVQVAPGGVELAAGPNTEIGPQWRGGTWITNRSSLCTAGFVWKKWGVTGERMLSTANHCGGGTWYGYNGRQIGRYYYYSTAADASLLRMSAGQTVTNKVWILNDAKRPSLRTVQTTGKNTVGGAIAYYGRTSGQSVGKIVSQWKTGYWLTNISTVRKGDSGGPVFVTANNGNVIARGMVNSLTYRDNNRNGVYDSADTVTGMIFTDATYISAKFSASVLGQ